MNIPNTFVLDANIISYYLKDENIVVQNIRFAVAANDNILLDPFACYEVKRGLVSVNSKGRLRKFNDFCHEFSVGQFDNNTLDVAVDIYSELRNKGRIVDEIDILIAAYCRRNQFTLVTHNTRHFESVANLALVDWMSL
jgi:predicted nucleic acid-binding protein